MENTLRKILESNNIEEVNIKQIEYSKRISSIDQGLINLFQGIFNEINCLILEVQNIDNSIIYEILDEYFKIYSINQSLSLKIIGLHHDNIKNIVSLFYEFPENHENMQFMKDKVKLLSDLEKLQIIYQISEKVCKFQKKNNIPIHLIRDWNIILNNYNEVFFIDICLDAAIFKAHNSKGLSLRRRNYNSLSPESIKNNYNELKGDVWFLGILLFETFITNNDKDFYSFMKIEEVDIKHKLSDPKTVFNFKNLLSDTNVLNLISSSLKVDIKQRCDLKDFFDSIFTILMERAKYLKCQECNNLYTISKYHCDDCQRNLCTKCQNFSHSNHTLFDIENIKNENKENYNKIISVIKEINNYHQLTHLNSKNILVERHKNSIINYKSETEKEIKKNSIFLKELIDEIEKSQIELLNSYSSKFFKKINEFHEEILKRNESIKTKLNFLNIEVEILKNSQEFLKNNKELRKLNTKLEDLKYEVYNTDDYFRRNLVQWDKQFISKVSFTKNVNDNLTSNLLENITFVKFNSLLKCSKTDDYIINDDLLLKYLEENFYHMKKFLPTISGYLSRIVSSFEERNLGNLKKMLLNHLENAKSEIFCHVQDELSRQYDELSRFNAEEMKILINKEKIKSNSNSFSSSNLIINIEKEIEDRILDNVKKYLISNKKKILYKLSLVLTQDIIIQIFNESFEFNMRDNIDGKLDFKNLKIGPDGMKILAELIKSCPNILELNLKQNFIGNEGCEDLGEMIKKTGNLQSLILEGNEITHTGIRMLCSVFKTYTNLKISKLNLSNNEIGPEGVLILSESLNKNTLTYLDLGMNNIQDLGVKYLSRFLQSNKTLKTLSLFNNSLTFDCVDYLVEAFGDNQCELWNLSLNSNNFTSQGIKKLADCFSDNISLQNIDLGNNEISEESSIFIVDLLKKNRSIKEISLNINFLTYQSVLDILEAIKSNQIITCIQICDNNVDLDKFINLDPRLKLKSSNDTGQEKCFNDFSELSVEVIDSNNNDIE